MRKQQLDNYYKSNKDAEYLEWLSQNKLEDNFENFSIYDTQPILEECFTAIGGTGII